jgi:hypothetical protein
VSRLSDNSIRSRPDVVLRESEASPFSKCYKVRFFAGVYPELTEGAQNDVATQSHRRRGKRRGWDASTWNYQRGLLAVVPTDSSESGEEGLEPRAPLRIGRTE